MLSGLRQKYKLFLRRLLSLIKRNKKDILYIDENKKKELSEKLNLLKKN